MHWIHSSFADYREATKESKAQEEEEEEEATDDDDDDGTQGPLPHSSKDVQA